MLSRIDKMKLEAFGIIPLLVNSRVIGLRPCVKSLIDLSNATKFKAIDYRGVYALQDGGLVIPVAVAKDGGDILEPVTYSYDVQKFAHNQSFTAIDLSNVHIEDNEDNEDVYSHGCSCLLRGCESLIKVDVSNFDTSKAKHMDYMFDGCASLVSLDLSNLDTNRVTDMCHMFAGCKELRYLNLSNFNTIDLDLRDTYNMFEGCENLRRIIINRKRNPAIVEQFYKNATDYHINNVEIVEPT